MHRALSLAMEGMEVLIRIWEMSSFIQLQVHSIPKLRLRKMTDGVQSVCLEATKQSDLSVFCEARLHGSSLPPAVTGMMDFTRSRKRERARMMTVEFTFG